MPTSVTRFLLEEGATSLPMSPIAIGLMTFVVFLFLLAVTWAFRGTAHKYDVPTDGHGAPGREIGHGGSGH